MSGNGAWQETLEYSLRLPIIYYGVPLPGKSNPYIVLISARDLVRIKISVEETEGASSVNTEGTRLGWRYDVAIKAFVDEVATRLEQPLKIRLSLEVDGVTYPPASSVYAAVTLSIVQAVSEQGGYELSAEEVLQAANDIDYSGGAGLDYIEAMRAAIVRGKSLIYRRGEESIELPSKERCVFELVGEEDISEDIASKLEDPLYSEITRLLGLNTVQVAGIIREKGCKGLDELVVNERIENSAYYALYGANPPDPGCKWTPSLQRVYAICRPGRNLGDRVEFML